MTFFFSAEKKYNRNLWKCTLKRQQSFSQYKEIVASSKLSEIIPVAWPSHCLNGHPRTSSGCVLDLVIKITEFSVPNTTISTWHSKVESSFDLCKLTAAVQQHNYALYSVQCKREPCLALFHTHCFTTILLMIPSLQFGSCFMLNRPWCSKCWGSVNSLTSWINQQNFNFQPIQC